MIVLSIGVSPESKIAIDAGLEVNNRKAIVVNKEMKTSDENIYALGDAVEVIDYINGNPTMIPLAWPANRQGHVVADNICGKKSEYNGTLGYFVAKVFSLTVATTGNNEKTLKRLNLEYKAIHLHPNSHAGYYPGAFPISLKVLFNPKDGKLLGAQGVGLEGVEKRIDVIATAIKGNLKVTDLPELELCYAPPYSSAKDPVNMAGYIGTNIMDNLVSIVQWDEVDNLIANNEFILDVREEMEFEVGHIENAINIPLGTLRNNLNKIPKDKTIYVYCQVGLRGYIGCRILSQYGFNCVNLDGGYKTYATVKSSLNNKDTQSNLNNNSEDCTCETSTSSNIEDSSKVTVSLDACGLQCPGPIRRVFEEIGKMKDGDILEVKASDPGFQKDINSWCSKTGNTLVKGEFDKKEKAFVALIKKGTSQDLTSSSSPISCDISKKDGATLVVFSGDLDKAIASFIIATGAASMGKPVTMFFTFWGLNILKRKDKPSVKKDTMEKMFDMMLPSSTGKLPLSKMNMAGMGPAMIKNIMAKNNVDDLDTLIANALKMGVKIIACAMSMDLMGIKHEELIPEVEVGGVATYLASTEDAGLNLFI